MENVKTIVIVNNVTRELAQCVFGEGIEYNGLILSLESIVIGPEHINDVDKIVREKLEDLGGTIKEINEKADNKEPDMTIILADGLPIVWANTSEKNKAIFVGEIFGNCIDRFMAHNMNTFMSNVRLYANKIEQGTQARMQEKAYHDSAVFETDFAALTNLKNLCLKMADKIQKLQENLTNTNYTA